MRKHLLAVVAAAGVLGGFESGAELTSGVPAGATAVAKGPQPSYIKDEHLHPV